MVKASGPSPKPERKLSEKETVRYWGRDAADHRKLADRNNDLIDHVQGQCQ